MKKINLSEARLKQIVDETVTKFIKENNPTIPQRKVNAVSGPQGTAVATQTPTQTSATVAPRTAPMAKPVPNSLKEVFLLVVRDLALRHWIMHYQRDTT